MQAKVSQDPKTRIYKASASVRLRVVGNITVTFDPIKGIIGLEDASIGVGAALGGKIANSEGGIGLKGKLAITFCYNKEKDLYTKVTGVIEDTWKEIEGKATFVEQEMRVDISDIDEEDADNFVNDLYQKLQSGWSVNDAVHNAVNNVGSVFGHGHS